MKGFALPFCAKLQSSIHFIHSMFCWEKSDGICPRKVRGDSFHHLSCHLCREVCFVTGECFVDRALVSTSSWSAPDVIDAKLVKMEVLMPKSSIEIRMGPSVMASKMVSSCNCLQWNFRGKQQQGNDAHHRFVEDDLKATRLGRSRGKLTFLCRKQRLLQWHVSPHLSRAKPYSSALPKRILQPSILKQVIKKTPPCCVPCCKPPKS